MCNHLLRKAIRYKAHRRVHPDRYGNSQDIAANTGYIARVAGTARSGVANKRYVSTNQQGTADLQLCSTHTFALSGLFDSITVHLSVERAGVDAKFFSCGCTVAAMMIKGFLNRAFLNAPERQRSRRAIRFNRRQQLTR